MKPELSIVIPTFNRLPILKRVLKSLSEQSVEKERFELILVDDGSADGTSEYAKEYEADYPFTYIRQENSGPAKARNRGMESAKADRIAFFGDDTILDSHCVSHHLGSENGAGEKAILGYTTWHPELRVTPFMDYINRFGLQFGYDIIPDPKEVPFNFFYTSNISLPLEAIRDAGGFNSSFPFAAWEDIECAYRMMKTGLRMIYRSEARCLHHHATTISSFSVRQYKSGIAAATMFDLHPELGEFLGVHLAVEMGQERQLSLKVKERLCGRLEGQAWFRPGGWYRSIMENHYLRGLSAELFRRKIAI